LERVPPSTSSCPSATSERTKQVFKVDVLEPALEPSCSLAAKPTEAAEASAEGVASSSCASPRVETAILVKGSRSVRVVGLLLLSVGQDFVSRLRGGELLLGRGFLVCVGMEFLREAVVCLLDIGGRGALVDAERLVGIRYCMR
jgi:hypothetical protein